MWSGRSSSGSRTTSRGKSGSSTSGKRCSLGRADSARVLEWWECRQRTREPDRSAIIPRTQGAPSSSSPGLELVAARERRARQNAFESDADGRVSPAEKRRGSRSDLPDRARRVFQIVPPPIESGRAIKGLRPRLGEPSCYRVELE